MSKTIITIVKKININKTQDIEYKDEILSTITDILNHRKESIKEEISWETVKRVRNDYFSTLLNTIKKEIEFYITRSQYIPKLKDTLNHYPITRNDFFIELKNDNVQKRTDDEVLLYFVSSKLVLLDSFSDKILVSPHHSIEDNNPYCFLLDLSNDISIFSYEKIDENKG